MSFFYTKFFADIYNSYIIYIRVYFNIILILDSNEYLFDT